jgi:hypothetical protein
MESQASRKIMWHPVALILIKGTVAWSVGNVYCQAPLFWGRILLILSPISCWLHISYLMMSWWFLLAESNVPSTLRWLSPQVEGVGKGIDGQQAQRWEGWARPVSGQYQASIPMFHVKMVKNGTHTRRLFLIPAQGHGHGSKSVASSRQPRWLPQFRKWFTVSF